MLLWDLDGTIVDTSRDLAGAINRMLADYGYSPLGLAIVVGHIGKGAQNLVARCLEEYGHRLEGDPGWTGTDSAPFGASPTGAVTVDEIGSAAGPHVGVPKVGGLDKPGDTVAAALGVFERHYAAHLLDETTVYAGVADLLRDLSNAGREMAVVSNKPEGFCRDILDRLELSPYFHVVVGGETLPRRKPAPDPIWYAIEKCTHPNRSPVSTSSATTASTEAVLGPLEGSRGNACAVMIGDTWIDTEAARAAGIPAILVGWGLGDRDLARASAPDAWAEDATVLRQLLT
ncbi:MAG: HAD hydrolase-like protein [Candidatus Eisenbacteria bacterium]